ncbi:MAG: pseudouridine synthase [Gammaproteobacteria bacterium]|nr:pseudouridine synthase [Gammaproteobacteria bacterium]MCW8910746.1 pseudouridine synthase [Gammaproteobacteria bacterium]
MNYSPPPDTGLVVLFQDDYLLAVNKPSGLLSVPGKGEDKKDCMALRVQQRIPDALIVHRLDMATSGIMLMALNKDIHRELSISFQDRMVSKSYIAIIDGLPEEDLGSVDLPMITDWPNRPRQKIDYDSGKASLTHYKVLDRNPANQTTRVELIPETGRTHQLRVHMQAIGHAIVGDRLYAESSVQEKSDRLLLHARQLVFNHPVSKDPITISCDAEF